MVIMIYIKMYETENGGTMVAMCDEKLIGKVLEEADIVLDMKTYADFYKGELVDSATARRMIEQASRIESANIVGEESIGVGIDTGLVMRSNIRRVMKIPYAQSYRVESNRAKGNYEE